MASVMELMRELKHLGELRKAGQISPEQEERLKDIRAVLDQQMGKSGPGRVVTSPGTPAPTRSTTNPGSPAPTRSTTSPGAPAPGRASTSPGTPAPARPAGRGPVADFESPKGDPNAFTIDLPDELAGAVQEAAAKADAAMAANKRREKPKDAEAAVQQLTDVVKASQYTPPELFYGNEYFAYEGLESARDADVELPLIDPRAEELKLITAGLATDAGDAKLPSVAPGGVFLDDFLELYSTGLLSTEAFWEDEGDSDDPDLLIPGKRKVTVHMASGEVKRGVIQRMARQDQGFTLLPQGPGKSESISLQQIKAIFVNLNPGAPSPAPRGKAVTVTFTDRRSIQGSTTDYGQGPSFTLIPPPGRGGVEMIIVNQGACADVR